MVFVMAGCGAVAHAQPKGRVQWIGNAPTRQLRGVEEVERAAGETVGGGAAFRGTQTRPRVVAAGPTVRVSGWGGGEEISSGLIGGDSGGCGIAVTFSFSFHSKLGGKKSRVGQWGARVGEG